jgi:hypothetical protein
VNLKRRLEHLEGQAEKMSAPDEGGGESYWAAMVLCKHVERHQARIAGEEPPPYTQKEIEEMRRSDIESVEGWGVEAQLRESIGWQTQEAQQALDEWEREAQRRVQKAKDLHPERWGEVWGVDEEG